MPKADKDGVYRLGRSHIFVRKGTVIPEGAEPIEDAATEERALDAAPENKARQGAPENRKRSSKKDSE